MATKCCLRVFKTLLTIGYAKRSGGIVAVPQPDGYISSLMTYLLLTAAMIALMLSQTLSLSQTTSVTRHFIFLTVSIVLAGSTCALLTVTCCARVRRRISVDCQPRPGLSSLSWRVCAQTIIPLLGLLLFLLGILLIEIMKSIAYASCLANSGYKRKTLARGVIGFSYHVIKSIFSISVFTFICVYSTPRRCLINSARIRYLLAVFLATMTYLYTDMAAYTYFFQSVEYSRPICYRTPPPEMTLHQQCVCVKTAQFHRAAVVQQYVHPFYIEFLMLAIERMFHVFSVMKGENDGIGQG